MPLGLLILGYVKCRILTKISIDKIALHQRRYGGSKKISLTKSLFDKITLHQRSAGAKKISLTLTLTGVGILLRMVQRLLHHLSRILAHVGKPELNLDLISPLGGNHEVRRFPPLSNLIHVQ